MSISFTEAKNKFKRMAKTNDADALDQAIEDMNTGYAKFNAKLSRYFTRKQQFTNLIANQSIYQTPVDSIRAMGMTVTIGSSTYQPPVKEIRSEYRWRQITSYPVSSNWPTYYYVLGNDQIQLWPTPSQNVTNGLRFYYQPQDFPLSIDDTNSSSANTVTVTNGSATVTAAASAFSSSMVGQWFQVTGVPNLTWYEIVVATSTTLTLKSAFVGPTASGLAWRVAQIWIIPQEYQEAPIHYALSNFYSAQGNEGRAELHMKRFNDMCDEAKEEYSSSNTSSVVTGDDEAGLNIWQVPPPSSPV